MTDETPPTQEPDLSGEQSREAEAAKSGITARGFTVEQDDHDMDTSLEADASMGVADDGDDDEVEHPDETVPGDV